MLARPTKQSAFSLVEIMIALGASSFLLLGLFGLYIANSKYSKHALVDAKFDTTMQAVSDLIERDVSNAGYWAGAGTSTTNPFMVTGSTELYVSPSGDCVLLTYDKDGDGALPAISSAYDDERYGYRLQSGAIQFRPWGATFSCSAASSDWVNLTDPNSINVQAVSFTPQYVTEDIDGAGAGTSLIRVGWFTINMQASPVDNSAHDKYFIRHFRLKNDKYIP